MKRTPDFGPVFKVDLVSLSRSGWRPIVAFQSGGHEGLITSSFDLFQRQVGQNEFRSRGALGVSEGQRRLTQLQVDLLSMMSRSSQFLTA